LKVSNDILSSIRQQKDIKQKSLRFNARGSNPDLHQKEGMLPSDSRAGLGLYSSKHRLKSLVVREPTKLEKIERALEGGSKSYGLMYFMY
jgi:hypothetical protein